MTDDEIKTVLILKYGSLREAWRILAWERILGSDVKISPKEEEVLSRWQVEFLELLSQMSPE